MDRFPRVVGKVPSELCSGLEVMAVGEGGVCVLPLKVFLEDLLEPDNALALGLVSISAMPSERRAEA